MDADEKQFLLTTAWLFAKHGQGWRARILLEALMEENAGDGVVAAMLADLLLDEGKPQEALAAVRSCDFPPALQRAGALLETRALRLLGRREEADDRWARFRKASRGNQREWIS